jgi:hypothetical protein
MDFELFLETTTVRITIILVCIMFASCSKKIQTREIPTLPVKNVQRCNYLTPNGKYSAQQSWYPLTDNQKQRLAEWLNQKSGWTECSETFAPRLVFKAESFNLNVMPKSAVLNYASDGGTWRQVCVELKPTDIDLFASTLAALAN